MGESTQLWEYHIQKDLDLMQYVSSVNIACGYHAGDTETMSRLCHEAHRLGKSIGAHPSFYDPEGFGRREMNLSPKELEENIINQLETLKSAASAQKARIRHVKPHGALYNMAALDPEIAEAICRAILTFDPTLILYGLAGSHLIRAGIEAGLQTGGEGFADRTYQEDGSLTPRSKAGALIEDVAHSLSQVMMMVQEGLMLTGTGLKIPIEVQTICIHSDGAHALEFASAIQEGLGTAGILIEAIKRI
jgi:UPF0271 protein